MTYGEIRCPSYLHINKNMEVTVTNVQQHGPQFALKNDTMKQDIALIECMCNQSTKLIERHNDIKIHAFYVNTPLSFSFFFFNNIDLNEINLHCNGRDFLKQYILFWIQSIYVIGLNLYVIH